MTTKNKFLYINSIIFFLLIELGTMSFSSLVSAAPIENIISGEIETEKTGKRILTDSEVQLITHWLEQHKSEWQSNLATSPAPTASIILNTATQKPNLILRFWSGSKYPGWKQAIMMESPIGNPLGIQTIKNNELNPILKIVED